MATPGMNVERGEQGGARMPGVVDGDTTDPGPGTASLETPVEVARLVRRPRQGREHEPGFRPLVGGHPGRVLIFLPHSQGGHTDARQGKRGVRGFGLGSTMKQLPANAL